MMMKSAFAQTSSPKALGYTFPDEWEVHAGTMMIFPARHSYGRETKGLREEFVAIAEAIAKNEPVHVFCMHTEEAVCRKLFGEMERVTIHPGDYPVDWARDHAPMVIRNDAGALATAGFRTNGWGKKYKGWQKDVGTRDAIAKAMNWPVFSSDLVLEGGAIEIGGAVGIVTESCVLNPNRTDWPKAKVENELKEMLGLDQIIWIKSGLMPDAITDGHVDGLLKFIGPNRVLLHVCDDKEDINFQICEEARKVLREAGMQVVELPLMGDIVHMNFYIGSGGDTIYVPVCGNPQQDEPPLKVLRKIFANVVPMVAKKLAEAGGGIHCYTQQIPANK